jgi:hypothetical protein
MKGIHPAPDEFDFAFRNNRVQLSRNPIQPGLDHGNSRIAQPTR